MNEPDRRATVLWVTSLANFLTPFMGSAINVALPAIGVEFEMKAVTLTWVMMSYLLATAVFLLPFGRFSDLHGRTRVFRTGLGIFTAVSALLALAPSGGVLIALRAVQGVGGAMIFCTATPILLASVPPGKRGRALGINVAAVYLGLSLGPVLGGLLTRHAGWHAIFWFTAALGGVTLLLSRTRMEDDRIEETGASAPRIASLLRGNPVFVFSNLAALINYSASAAVGVLLSLYLQHIKGLKPDTAGFVLLTQPVLMTIFSPPAGRLSDRVQPRIVASLGMGAMTAALAWLAFLTAETPLPQVFGALGLLGLGFAFFSSPNTNAVMSAAPPELHGVASATLSTMRALGGVASMGIVMLFLSLFVGPSPLAPPVYPQVLAGLRAAFPTLAGLGALGTLASLARGNVRPPAPDAVQSNITRNNGRGI